MGDPLLGTSYDQTPSSPPSTARGQVHTVRFTIAATSIYWKLVRESCFVSLMRTSSLHELRPILCPLY